MVHLLGFSLTCIRQIQLILLCWITILNYEEIEGERVNASSSYENLSKKIINNNNNYKNNSSSCITTTSSEKNQELLIQCSKDNTTNINLIQLWDNNNKLILKESQQNSISHCITNNATTSETAQCYTLYVNGVKNCKSINIFINGILYREIELDDNVLRIGNNCSEVCNNMDEIFLFVKDHDNNRDNGNNNITNNANDYNYSLYNESQLVEYGSISINEAYSFCKNTIDCIKLLGATGSDNSNNNKYYYSLLRDGAWMETNNLTYHTFGNCPNICDNNPELYITTRGQKLQFLAASFSGMEAVQNKYSTIYKATCWIIYDDIRQVEQNDTLEFFQRLILVSFYYEMNNYNGYTTSNNMWINNYSFLSPSSVCQWNDNNNNGVICNGNGEIIRIKLQLNNLHGTINTELFRLRHLEYLDLSQNYITGTLSSHVGILLSLKELYLYKNSMHGTIPEEMLELDNLQVLNINNNLLIGDVKLLSSNLLFLDVSRNLLNGTLIPSSIETMISLKYLYASHNALNCTIPEDIIQLQNLKVINLSNNQLFGSIPQRIFTLSSLEYLNISYNKLTSSIPTYVNVYNPTWLSIIDFSHNNIQGTIPSTLDKLLYLKSLNLSQNNIRGSIPNEIILNLQLLNDLQLQNNKLTGYIMHEDCNSKQKVFENLITDCGTIYIICECCTECYYSIYDDDYYDDDDDNDENASLTNKDYGVDGRLHDSAISESNDESNNDSNVSKGEQQQQPPLYQTVMFKRAFFVVATAFLISFVVKFAAPRRQSPVEEEDTNAEE